jgi:hypothetical protein
MTSCEGTSWAGTLLFGTLVAHTSVPKKNTFKNAKVFEGVLMKAEDTGLEPATHYWATDFESAC